MTTLSSILPPISLASATGTLPVGNGGTGVTTSTGAGSVVLSEGPSITLGNATGLPLTTGVTGTLPVANGGTGAATLTGVVKGNGENAFTAGTVSVSEGGTGAVTLTGVVKGTGTSALTAGTVSLTAEVSGTLPVANGGTGAATLAANNVLLGNGTSAVQAVAPGASGNVLTSNGTTWASAAAVSGVQQFTSSGSITAGQAVSLNSNGTVSTTTGVSQSEAFGTISALSGYAVSSSRGAGFFDTTTEWHLNAYQDSSSGTLYAYAFKLDSSGNISVINSVTLSAPGFLVSRFSLCKGSTGNVYAFMYTSLSGNGIRFFEMTNTSTGALTSRGTIGFGGSQNNYWFGDCYYDSNADRVVAFYNDGSAALGIAAVNYNSNSPTITATSSTSLGTTIGQNASLAAAYNTTTNTGRVFYGRPDNSYVGVSRVVTLNSAGTSFTVGSVVQFDGNNCQYSMRAVYFPNIDRFVIQTLVNTYSSLVTRTIVPSTGNAENGTSSSPSGTSGQFGLYGFSAGYDFTNNVVYNVYANSTLRPFSYTASTSSLNYVAGTASTDGAVDWIGNASVSFDQTNARLGLTAVSNSAGSRYARGYIPSFFSTTADRFIGFSTQSVSTGAAVTITTLGGVNANQSALTTGTAYYLQFNGALSTTPSAYGTVARALSATSVQVTTGGAFKKLLSQTVIAGSPTSLSFTLPSGYTQFELAFQNVVGGSNASPVVQSATSGGSGTYYSGKGQAFLGSSSPGSYTQGGTILYLTGNQTHSSGSPFGGSLLIQSSASTAYWSYQLMTNFNNGGDSYFSGAGWFNNIPANITLSGFGTLTNGGVVTLYGIG